MADITEFSVGRGETFKFLLTITNSDTDGPLNLTDYSFVGQVRENYTSDEVAATFNITKVSPPTSGSIFVELAASQTSDLTQRKYVYDIKMSSGSIAPITRRIVEGYLVVRPAATR